MFFGEAFQSSFFFWFEEERIEEKRWGIGFLGEGWWTKNEKISILGLDGSGKTSLFVKLVCLFVFSLDGKSFF